MGVGESSLIERYGRNRIVESISREEILVFRLSRLRLFNTLFGTLLLGNLIIYVVRK